MSKPVDATWTEHPGVTRSRELYLITPGDPLPPPWETEEIETDRGSTTGYICNGRVIFRDDSGLLNIPVEDIVEIREL